MRLYATVGQVTSVATQQSLGTHTDIHTVGYGEMCVSRGAPHRLGPHEAKSVEPLPTSKQFPNRVCMAVANKHVIPSYYTVSHSIIVI